MPWRKGSPVSAGVQLLGYRYSVYTRIVRMVLREKGVVPEIIEIDPFAPPSADGPSAVAGAHPFARVPVLRHDDFELYETAAITRYVDTAFPGPSLTSDDPRTLARIAQVIGIVDSYGYWPMVRQVFSHAVFRPFEGEPSNAAEIARGLESSHPVLGALETISREGRALNGGQTTLADCHLGAMVAYFVLSDEGARALRAYPCLARWWETIEVRGFVTATDPGVPPVRARELDA